MGKKFSFLVIGTNFISDNFACAIGMCESAEISSVLSRRVSTGEEFSDKHGGGMRIFTSLEDAYSAYTEEGLFDGVYIASPNSVHKPQSEFFLSRGIPVLCEKPATTSVADFDYLSTLADKTGTVYLEAMRPAHDITTDIIRRGMEKILPIRSVRLEFSQYSSRYGRYLSGENVNTFNPKLGNSSMLDLGIYAVSTLLMLFGEGYTDVKSSSVFLENGFEASGVSLIEYEGFTATVAYSKVCDGASPSVILGEGGSITVDRLSEPRSIILTERGKAPVQLCTSPCENNMVYEIGDFVRAACGEISTRKWSELCRAQLVLCERMRNSRG